MDEGFYTTDFGSPSSSSSSGDATAAAAVVTTTTAIVPTAAVILAKTEASRDGKDSPRSVMCVSLMQFRI